MHPLAQGPSPATRQRHRLHTFASLEWYEAVIKFVFTFTARTSEMLLAAGLVVSTANFLTDGQVMGSNAHLAAAWAWAQALAIDSSLGVTFYYVFLGIKQRDWIKVCCYALLTLLLAIVAGTITNVDTFSHAIHTSIANATIQVGLDTKILTTLRAIAVVGFVLMSRLKDVSFKELYEPSSPSREFLALQEPKIPENQKGEKTDEHIKKLIAEAVAPFMAGVARQEQTIILEEQEILPLLVVQTTTTPETQQSATVQQADTESQAYQREPSSLDQQDDSSEAQDARLANAYQELQVEGKRISGRTLAARAHIRRSTCNQWLAAHHPKVANGEPEEDSEHRQL